MFNVTGSLNGVHYQLAVHPEVRDLADLPSDEPIVTGSTDVITAIYSSAGRSVAVTPTGPFMVVDTETGEGVLAALYALTDVDTITGDAPMLFPSDPYTVY